MEMLNLIKLKEYLTNQFLETYYIHPGRPIGEKAKIVKKI